MLYNAARSIDISALTHQDIATKHSALGDHQQIYGRIYWLSIPASSVKENDRSDDDSANKVQYESGRPVIDELGLWLLVGIC